jgi:uncharacterized Zn-finger protein
MVNSQFMKEETIEEEPCFIEYIEEEFIEEPQNSDYESNESCENDNEIKFGKEKGRRQYLETVEMENESITCDLCPKTFDRKDYYRRHFRRAHLINMIEEKTAELTEEGRFEEIPQLNMHQCEFCGKILVSLESFLAHKEEHEGEPRFKCKKCSFTFNNKEEARKHLNTHSSDEKPFVCTVCSKCFKNRYQLILHTRSHTGEYFCFGFVNSLLLILFSLFQGEKPFKCPFEVN